MRRRRYELLVGFFAFGGLMLGYHGPWSPWGLLHHNLPIFDSLRVPSRFTVLCTFYLCLMAGLTLSEVARALRGWSSRSLPPRRLRWLPAAAPWIVALLACLHPVISNTTVQDRWFGPKVATDHMADRFHLVPGSDYHWIYASLPQRNQGTAACYAGNMNWRISHRLWNGPQDQLRIVGRTGEVHDWGRTPNRVWAYVTLDADGRVVFNQNYHPDWVASSGVAVEDSRRLAVDLPAGTHHLEVRYRPLLLVPGVVVSAVGVIVACGFLVLGRRRRG